MDDINFCPRCGHATEDRQAYGRLRPVCPACERVHFIDPKVAVGVVIVREGQLLLIRRAIDPQRGKWSVPAGYVDKGEAPAAAAIREAAEETGLVVRITALLDVIAKDDQIEGADIFIVYRAEVIGGDLCPGDDAADAGYFTPAALPDLAFASTRAIIARWQAADPL